MNIIKRFWKYVDKRGSDECWEWTGGLKENRYGHFSLKGKTYRAHRVSWAIAHRTWPIPKGRYICHTCDNPTCVNPNHLYLGTPASNMQDRSPLSPEDVREIRYLRKFEAYSYEQLSYKFNVIKRTIRNICKYKSWSNV